MSIVAVIFASLLLCALSILATRPIAQRVGLVDVPGGHKRHDSAVPLVGGISIFISLAIVWLGAPHFGAGQISDAAIMSAGLLMLVGMVDDRHHLSIRIRFAFQAVAALIMAMVGGVVLHDFGHLWPGTLVELGWLAIPITIFSTLGVINAFNMIDGIDGLAGSVALVILGLLMGVALMAGDVSHMLIIGGLMGAVGGFLCFNLRAFGRARARVFMGDAGSTILGFLFVWLFISMSQVPAGGGERLMTPTTALWLCAIPLMDSVAVMIRRAWLGKSPFGSDRGHLHHILGMAGFRVHQVVLVVAALQLLLGAIGIAGMQLGVPESVMYFSFLGLFVVYTYRVSRPWRAVPVLRQLHRGLGLSVAGSGSVFVGNLDPEQAVQQVRGLLGDDLAHTHFRVFDRTDEQSGRRHAYAVVETRAPGELRRTANYLSRRASFGCDMVIRQFIPRNPANDRRIAGKAYPEDKRIRDRRSNSESLTHCTRDEVPKVA